MEPDDGLVKDVYTRFGLAAYFGQCFEAGLCTLLLLDARMKGEVASVAEIDALELAHQKKTMGKLIKALQSRTQLPANAEAAMKLALDYRNFLNHRFFRERALDFMSVDGCRRMLAELECIQAVIQKADELCKPLCMALFQFLRIGPEVIEAEYAALMEKARAQA